MSWTDPVTHSVGDFIDAEDWNDEITENHKAIIAPASTTVSALNTVWGGAAPPDGATGRLKIGASPFDFLDVRYDTAITRWVSEPTWHRMQSAAWGATGQTLATNVAIGNRLHEPAHPWQIFEDAGLQMQLCLYGIFGAEGTGATGANSATPIVYSLDYGAAPPLAGSNGVTSNGSITTLTDSAAGTTGTMRFGIWGVLAGGYTARDVWTPGVVMNQAGTGTANFYAANVTVGHRWISQ